MALQAVDAVVDVVADLSVMAIGGCLGVAVGAGKNGQVTLVGVALRALPLLPAVIGGELADRGVVERRAGPIDDRRQVAGRAGVREELRVDGRAMRWRRRVGVVRYVAAIAIGGRAREFAADVAAQAHRGGVLADQRETHIVVVEGGAGPIGRRMADGAILGIAKRDVIRIGGAVVAGYMARIAIGGERRVLIIGMARQTGNRCVLAGQRELGLAVIEGGASPVGC